MKGNPSFINKSSYEFALSISCSSYFNNHARKIFSSGAKHTIPLHTRFFENRKFFVSFSLCTVVLVAGWTPHTSRELMQRQAVEIMNAVDVCKIIMHS